MSNYTKLKTNLKLAIQRLKLLEKKKTEQSLKARQEIAEYLKINKPDRARIRVEHIIREDNYVEGMEMLEMFCDLLLARFGLIERMQGLDPGLDEAISTLLWSAPRISNDIQEFKIIGDILSQKYGKKYAEACKTDEMKKVNEKVKRRLGVEPPPKRLVEQYLVEIAKNFNVDYKPDISLEEGELPNLTGSNLIDFGASSGGPVDPRNNNNNNNEGGGGAAAALPAKGLGFDPIMGDNTYVPDDAAYHRKPPIPAGSFSDGGAGATNTEFLPPPLMPTSLPFGTVSPPRALTPSNKEESTAPSLPPTYSESIGDVMSAFGAGGANAAVGGGGSPNINSYPEKPYVPTDDQQAPPLPSKGGSAGVSPSTPPQQPPPAFQNSPPPSYNNNARQPQQPPSAPPPFNLPSVPTNNNNAAAGKSADDEFDELQRRFANLKKM